MSDNSFTDTTNLCLDSTERNINKKLNNLLSKKNKKIISIDEHHDISCDGPEVSDMKSDILKILIMMQKVVDDNKSLEDKISSASCDISHTSHISSSVCNQNTTTEQNYVDEQINALRLDVNNEFTKIKCELTSIKNSLNYLMLSKFKKK